jgi:hypothetical protein
MTATQHPPDNRSKHCFNNKTNKVVTLVIEPWGRNYTIEPGMMVEFRMMSGAAAPAISIIYSVDVIAVYIEHTCKVVLT